MAERLLRELLPELAHEIEHGLREQGRDDLAEQIASLQIVSRCDCELADCATFRAVAASPEQWGSRAGSVSIPARGMVVLDVVHNVLDADGRVIVGESSPRITSVEVLEREDLHDALIALGIPPTPKVRRPSH